MYRFIFVLFWLILFSSPDSVAQTYLWPTNSGNYLSATFGETRSAHFHAGLDIKTWGREGYEVYASRDGILSRLLVTERGYGNAIYLQHEDGMFTIYAHLQRFSSKYKSLADSIRLQDYSFEMDARLDTLGIQVKQGDLIGYTGSTGIGPPHLHFELRDSLNQPINALTTNLNVKDNLPPVFSSLIIEPVDLDSRVEGKPVSLRKRASKISESEFDFGEINVRGKVGLAVNVYDRANEVHNAYAVYTLSLIHEEDTLFHEKLNSFNYEQTGEMFLDRISPFGSSRRGHQRLFAKDGHDNPFYLITQPKAKIHPEKYPKTYNIVATDYFGNTSTARLTITVSSTQAYHKSEIQNNIDFSIPPSGWYWSENWASPDLSSTINLQETDLGFSWGEHQQIIQTSDAASLLLSRVYPEHSQRIISPDYRMKVWFGSHTFFDTLSVSSAYKLTENEVHLSVQPQMLANKTSFRIEFYMGEEFQPENNYRLFRKKIRNGELEYVRSSLIGRTIHAMPDELGEFIIIADNEPPTISNFRIFQTDYGMWQASVRVEDELSGINSSTAWFSVNNERGIAEYDYEEDLLIYYMPGFEPQTNNHAVIIIRDKAGNEQAIQLDYQLSGQ